MLDIKQASGVTILISWHVHTNRTQTSCVFFKSFCHVWVRYILCRRSSYSESQTVSPFVCIYLTFLYASFFRIMLQAWRRVECTISIVVWVNPLWIRTLITCAVTGYSLVGLLATFHLIKPQRFGFPNYCIIFSCVTCLPALLKRLLCCILSNKTLNSNVSEEKWGITRAHYSYYA